MAVYNHYKRIYHEALHKWSVQCSHCANKLSVLNLCTFFCFLGDSCGFYLFTVVGEVRSTEESGNQKAGSVDDNRVELEKSNILLMGPTGSGNFVMSLI